MKKTLTEKSADINRQEIAESKACIEQIQVLMERAVSLAREVNTKLINRNIDQGDKRIEEATIALSYIENVIESLSLLIGYETATINIDRVMLEKD